ncbi:type II toxin-antitoxin system RelE/ParE family toxin [Planctomicrobium sp. SH661]|uniref:type II toxin-antitoxin system RelE/ParE family toxin n=1 Tax=Planctomicrobium sp. SH661 TaxID=3448124 RepID=UPI003F5B0B7D
MARYHISELARQDLVAIWKYIAADSRAAASDTLREFFETFSMIERQPLIGESRDDLLRGLRGISKGRYIVFYRLRSAPQIVEVVRVLHEARDQGRLF